jgi:hypothetical protein
MAVRVKRKTVQHLTSYRVLGMGTVKTLESASALKDLPQTIVLKCRVLTTAVHMAHVTQKLESASASMASLVTTADTSHVHHHRTPWNAVETVSAT